MKMYVMLAAFLWRALAEDATSSWARFHGPNGTGQAHGLRWPSQWDAQAIRWKVALPGLGYGSPIVHGGRIYLQAADAVGKERLVLCLAAGDGQILWKRVIGGQRHAAMHKKNSLASGTGACDGERVYFCHWDGQAQQLAAYRCADGQPLWSFSLGDHQSQHGPGHSPIVTQGKVIIACESDQHAQVYCVDAVTGKQVWTQERQAYRASYCTPVLRDGLAGQEVIVVSTAGVTGYQVATGNAAWSWTWPFAGKPLRSVSSPVLAGKVLLASAGDGGGDRDSIALQLPTSDTTEERSPRLLWQMRRDVPYVTCFLRHQEHVYYVADKGVAGCMEMTTGKTLWTQRLAGNFTSSPILVDGKIIVVNEEGEVFVFLAQSSGYQAVGRLKLEETVLASPAVADGLLFVRGQEHLFCLGAAGDPPKTPQKNDEPADDVLMPMLPILQQSIPASKPAFDFIILSDGRKLEGLVQEETAQQVRFQFLLRKPGVRTVVIDAVYDRNEVKTILRGTEPGKAAARQMFQQLEMNKKLDEERREKLAIQRTTWFDGQGALKYQGPYFELYSNVQESLFRLAATRLEEIYGAYVKTLGQRHKSEKLVRIVFFRSLAEYRTWQTTKGIQLLNPAVYDARTCEIVIGSDLDQQTQQLAALHASHQDQRKELDEQRKRIARQYGNQPPAVVARQLQQLDLQLHNLDAENEATYARLQAGFFAIAYHEAFHAYLDQWVFPSSKYAVPRWLNEGLAQLFENAFVEVDELRIGRLDEKRLREIQHDVRVGRFMSLREMLQSPAQPFFVRHTRETFEADRYYNASWALSHYLAFELKLLTSQALTEFVSQPESAQDAVIKFEKLVGMPLTQCEARWKDYLLRLRPDGSLRPSDG